MSPHCPTTPLKLLSCLHLMAVASQPVLAGQMLVGHPGMGDVHGMVGEAVAWLSLAMLGFGLVSLWAGRLAGLAVAALAVLFALAGLQVHAGHNGYLALHVPLGSFLLVASILMTLWLFREAGRSDPARS
ncbi:MAG: hypothetical protein K5872_16345 [Rhizobiaceae bacterium]|nr:hypothetical protein [Rhizobiaceae bacterium]MCV0407792.1 hypothetical protein [Rhizobiaceae bacterium]